MEFPEASRAHEGVRSDKIKGGVGMAAPEEKGRVGWRSLRFKAEVHGFLLG